MKTGVYAYNINVNQLKEDVHKALERRKPGPGYYHFPAKSAYNTSYFEGLLLSEVLKSKRTATKIVKQWWPNGRYANEPLDLAAYTLSAMHGLLAQNYVFSHPAAYLKPTDSVEDTEKVVETYLEAIKEGDEGTIQTLTQTPKQTWGRKKKRGLVGRASVLR